MDSCAISLFWRHLSVWMTHFFLYTWNTLPICCLCSVLRQPELHHLFKCANIKGASHLCFSSSERGEDIIFLKGEGALKCCVFASVRSHKGTELHFGGSCSSNGFKGKSYCFLFNKPQSNLCFTKERKQSRICIGSLQGHYTTEVCCVTMLLP